MFVCFCLGCGMYVCVLPKGLYTIWGQIGQMHLCTRTDIGLSGASCRVPLAPLAPCTPAYPLCQCLADQREASTDHWRDNTEHIEKSKSWEMVRRKLLLLVTLVGLSLCQVSACTLSFSHHLTTAWWRQLYQNLTTAPQQLDDSLMTTALQQLDDSLTIALWQWNI